MKVVLQRVKESSVKIENETVGEVSHGFLILLGIGKEDSSLDADWLAEKICKLRVFEDEEGKMNKDIMEVGGEILVVSQFTLYGDCKKGN